MPKQGSRCRGWPPRDEPRRAAHSSSVAHHAPPCRWMIQRSRPRPCPCLNPYAYRVPSRQTAPSSSRSQRCISPPLKGRNASTRASAAIAERARRIAKSSCVQEPSEGIQDSTLPKLNFRTDGRGKGYTPAYPPCVEKKTTGAADKGLAEAGCAGGRFARAPAPLLPVLSYPPSPFAANALGVVRRWVRVPRDGEKTQGREGVERRPAPSAHLPRVARQGRAEAGTCPPKVLRSELRSFAAGWFVPAGYRPLPRASGNIGLCECRNAAYLQTLSSPLPRYSLGGGCIHGWK